MNRQGAHFRFALLVVVLFVLAPASASAQMAGQSTVGEEESVLDGLDPLERHRAFPYVDKAVRAEQDGRNELAVAHWRNALDRAPGHVPLIQSLFEALLRIDRHEEAHELLGRYPGVDRLATLRKRVRLAWLRHPDRPGDSLWLQWLAQGDEEHATELVEVYAFSALDRDEPRDALDGLTRVPCPGPGCTAALRLRAAIAEQAGWPAEVVSALEALAQWEQWSRQDERRAVLAWMALSDWSALAGYLAREDSTASAELIEQAAQRAIGQQKWRYASLFLERLRDRGEAGGNAMAQLTEVYRELGELERAARNARDQGQCLRAVELARQASLSETARRWLGDCATGPAGAWLDLAISLEAVDLLRTRTFGQTSLEARRLEALAELLRGRDRDAELVEILTGKPGDRAQELLAAALEREQRYAEAAEIWTRRYLRSNNPGDLERATYLHLLADQGRHAAELLIKAAPFANTEQGRALSMRLLERYPLPELDPDGTALVRIGSRTDDRALRLAAATTLHRIGLCDRVADLEMDTDHDPGGQANLLLGFCLQRRAPGLAAHHFQAARERGATRATRPLAVLLAETGRPDRALSLWLELDARAKLSDDERRLLVETALQAGEYSTAAEQFSQLPRAEGREWWSMRARIEQGRGNFEQALQYWQEAHALRAGAESAFAIGVLQLKLENREAAARTLADAVERDPENAQYLAEYAFALEQENPSRAIKIFERAVAIEPWRFDVHEQIGYVNARLYRDRQARSAFRKAIDSLQPELPPTGLDGNEAIKRRYAARRMHETLGRDWSVQFAGWVSTGSVPGEFFFDRNAPRNYAQLLVQRRIGQRGPLGSLYARGRLLGDGGTDSPLARNAATLGLTWQLPVGISVVGLDWVISDDRSDQLLVHGATELLASGRFRRDWRPAEERWQEQRLFMEGAWWTESDDFLLSARYDRLVHFAIDGWQGASWFPYVAAEGRLVQDGHDLRVAAGVGLRKWTGQSRYNAYRRLHNVRVEFQQTVETNIADDNGIFLRIESEW